MTFKLCRAAFVAGASAFAACGQNTAQAQAVTSLRIVSGVTIGARAALYAAQAGIFKKYGLDVELVKAGSGGGTPLSALIGGSFQVDYVNVVSLIQAHAQGIALQIIAPGSMYYSERPYSLLFVRKESPIRSARDLNGKTSASQALKDINALCTLAWVDANGGDSKTLHGIELPNSAMLPALDEGRIDVTSLVPPFQTFALEAGKYRVLGKPYDAIAKHFQIAVWAATADYVAKNPDVARRFAAAMRESSQFANANPSKTDDLVSAFTGIEPRIVAHSPGPQDPPYITASDIQPVIDVALKYGFLTKNFSADEVISSAVRRA